MFCLKQFKNLKCLCRDETRNDWQVLDDEMREWSDVEMGRRVPLKILTICRFLDQKLDWITHWDPSGARARAPKMNKDGLWRYDFKEWCEMENEPYSSRSLFYYVWKKYYNHIYLTDLYKFRQCSLCKACNLEMRKADRKKDDGMKRAVFLLKSVHLEHVRNLRRNVKGFEKISKKCEDFMIVFGDRADSHNFSMPSWCRGVFVCVSKDWCLSTLQIRRMIWTNLSSRSWILCPIMEITQCGATLPRGFTLRRQEWTLTCGSFCTSSRKGRSWDRRCQNISSLSRIPPRTTRTKIARCYFHCSSKKTSSCLCRSCIYSSVIRIGELIRSSRFFPEKSRKCMAD